MILIDNTKPKSPKFEYNSWAKKNKPDSNASKLEIERYLDKELQRWIDGHMGLTGIHYFELTQCKIKRGRGTEIRPFWRQVDEEDVYEPYYEAQRKKNDALYVKRREVGLTTIFGGVVPIWSSIVNEGSNNLITSADKDRIKNIFIEKVSVIYDNLEQGVQPKKASPGRQEGFMHFGVKDKKTGITTGTKSSIICKETVDKTNSFETFRATTAFVDEFFLHPKASDVRISLQACCREGFDKFATVVMGGSCGVTSIEGMKDGMKLWNDASNLDIMTIFISGCKGISYAAELDDKGKPTGNILNFCPNGWNDEKSATEWILKTRDKLGKANDKRPYLSFIKEYPLTIEEVFSLSGEGILPEEVMTQVSKQKIYIMSNRPPIMTYNLYRENGVVVSEASPKGKFVLLDKPKSQATYIASTDPIFFNTENIEEGSKYVTGIKHRELNTYVALYAERNLNSDIVVSNSILLQDYFGRAKTMMEMNAGAVAKKIYEQLGRLDLLAKRPEFLGINFVSTKESYGYFNNIHTAPRLRSYLIQYLMHHSDKIFFEEILNQVPGYLLDNTDYLSMMEGMELYDNNIIAMQSKQIKVERPKQPSWKLSYDSSGKVVWKEY